MRTLVGLIDSVGAIFMNSHGMAWIRVPSCIKYKKIIEDSIRKLLNKEEEEREEQASRGTMERLA